jgi:hypothetical protein
MKAALLLTIFAFSTAHFGGVVLRTGNAGASSSTSYRLKRGDIVHVPALRWTCLVGTSPRTRTQELDCTTDDKPIASVSISKHHILVATGHAPRRSSGGYRFPY